jgi:hypothetical protein
MAPQGLSSRSVVDIDLSGAAARFAWPAGGTLAVALVFSIHASGRYS